jgi:multiple sugar transport system substrate-binding protein
MLRTETRFGALWVVAVALLLAACAAPAAPSAGPTSGATGAATSAPADTSAPQTQGPADTEAPSDTEAPADTSAPADTEAPADSAPPSFVAGSGDLRWYCCLGTGEDPDAQIPVEQDVAADWTSDHQDTSMTFEVVTYDSAVNTLSTTIAGGNPPDIVGPVGVGGIEGFHGQWLDLAPYLETAGFDTSIYAQEAVEFYNTADGQIGLPFATYPSMLWYSRSMFDEANLEYPPHAYGDPYVMPDGTEAEWTYATLLEVAKILTVDEAGNDATSPDFDPESIAQWGWEPQRDDLRGLGSYYGAGSLLAADGQTAEVPDAWAASWKDFYDSMWTTHITMTGPTFDSIAPDAGGYAFFSGRVAMSANFLWTTYGVGEDSGIEGDWDLAALPSFNGQTTSPLNADTFVIMETTEDPQTAVNALKYMQIDRGPELLEIYGGMPADTSQQDAFFATQDETFTHDVDWQVAKESLAYADSPNFEAFMPKYNESLGVIRPYLTRWTTEPGLDLDAEIAQLEADLQALWDAP